ncbi:MAG: NAD-binding protein [Bacteroidales bacterium]|nr:NAD-binding protein [Bacteroidales bacterium]
MKRRLLNSIIRYVLPLLLFIGFLVVLTSVESKHPGSSIQNIFDALWYAIVTLTTVGYGDLYPVTLYGKILGLVIILLSLGLLSLIIGRLTTVIQNYMEKKKMGHFGTQFENHMIIIGWNTFGKSIVDQMTQAKQKVAIVTNSKTDVELIKELYSDKVFVYYSDLTSFDSFSKINISNSTSVFVNIPDDSEALVYLINIKKRFPDINYVVSLSKPELKETFINAGATYVVSEKEISSKLIASFIFEPDVARFTEDIIATATDKSEYDIQEFEVTTSCEYLQKEYNDAFIELKKKYNAVLLGICKNKDNTLLKNPSEKTFIEEYDYLILMCNGEEKVNIEKAFGVQEGRRLE